MHPCIWDSLCPCHLLIFMFLVAICGCLSVMVYIVDKKMEGILENISFLLCFSSPCHSYLNVWQARALQVSPVHIRQVVFGQHPSRRARLCAWVCRTNTSHNITFREMNVSSLLFYLTWLFMVIWSVRRWSQRGYLLISVPVRTAILYYSDRCIVTLMPCLLD